MPQQSKSAPAIDKATAFLKRASEVRAYKPLSSLVPVLVKLLEEMEELGHKAGFAKARDECTLCNTIRIARDKEPTDDWDELELQ